MARYRHYDPQQTKMIAVSYGRQLLAGTFEHALSYLIDNEIDLDRFAARFKNDETGAQQDGVRFTYPDLGVSVLVDVPDGREGQVHRHALSAKVCHSLAMDH